MSIIIDCDCIDKDGRGDPDCRDCDGDGVVMLEPWDDKEDEVMENRR